MASTAVDTQDGRSRSPLRLAGKAWGTVHPAKLIQWSSAMVLGRRPLVSPLAKSVVCSAHAGTLDTRMAMAAQQALRRPDAESPFAQLAKDWKYAVARKSATAGGHRERLTTKPKTATVYLTRMLKPCWVATDRLDTGEAEEWRSAAGL